MLAQQHVQARGELAKGKTVTVARLGDHCLEGHSALQVVTAGIGGRDAGDGLGDRWRGVVLDQADKGLEEFFQEAALDAFAFQAQVAHGFEKGVLVDIVLGPVGHLEQGVVGVIEQFLQAMAQLLGGLVTDLKQNHRQAGERRSVRLIRSRLVQRHYIPVVVHPSLLKGVSLPRNERSLDAHSRVPAGIDTHRCISNSGEPNKRQSYDVN